MKTLLSEIKKNNKYLPELKLYFNKFVVYKITFSENNKIYIGQTKNLRKRLFCYLGKDNTNKHLVKKAIDKYDKSKIFFEIVKVCNTIDELNIEEIKYINFYESYKIENGYNLTFGGGNGTPTFETIQKKIDSSKKVKVGCYDLEGNLLNIYSSIKEASRDLDITDSDIHRCCKNGGKRKIFLFSKTLKNKIDPLSLKKQIGKWNLKYYDILDENNNYIETLLGQKELAKKFNVDIEKISFLIKKQKFVIENKKYYIYESEKKL